MNHCGEEHQSTAVADLLAFIDSSFNAATIAYFMTQNVVVFIDTQPLQNARRMLNRGTGGDSTRGRIKYYPHAQALAYYTVARLFGWKVFCVPYDYSSTTMPPKFMPEKYQEIADSMNQIFQVSSLTCNDNHTIPSAFSKPSNAYAFDNNYSKSVGIYK